MRRLALDYVRRPRQQIAVYVLAAFAAGLALDATLTYRRIEHTIADSEARLAERIAMRQRTAPKIGSPSFTVEQHAFARDTVRRLAMPWEDLFRALEAAHSDRIALLAIEPDPNSRAVSISGEAKDYLAALTYVAHLSHEPALTRVHLLRHENRRSTMRPVAFTVSASWTDEP